MRVVYAGGGTGGHVYPALAIDEALAREPRAQPLERRFFGSRDGLEARIVGDRVPMRFIPAAALQRRLALSTLATIAVNVAGVAAAIRELMRFNPDVVIATGGYVCFPVALAARMLRTVRLGHAWIAVLEINARPGLTTRLLAPLVDEAWITYETSRDAFGSRAVKTGTPTRASLSEFIPLGEARRALGLREDARIILAFGGSQGANSVNDAVLGVAEDSSFPAGWQILLLSGARDYERVCARSAAISRERLVVMPYLDELGPAYRAANIAVTRAGASTLAELAETGIAAILVAYPHAGSHQQDNIDAFLHERGEDGSTTIDDSALNGETLRAALDRTVGCEDWYQVAALGGLVRYFRKGSTPAARIASRIADVVAVRGRAAAAAKAKARHEG